MDRRTVIAVILCLLFLVFYQPLLRMAGFGKYLEPSRRPTPAAVDTTHADSLARVQSAAESARAAGGPAAHAPAVFAPLPIAAAAGALEKTSSIETPLYRATFTNRGARLLSVELKRYVSAHGVSSAGGKPRRVKPGHAVPPGDRVVLAGGPLFGVDLGSSAGLRPLDGLVYAVAESADATGQDAALTFTARDSSGLAVRQTWRVRPGTYALDLDVQVDGVPAAWRLNDYSLTVRSWPPFTETDRRTDERQVRATTLVGTNLHRDQAAGLLKGPRAYDGNAMWAAVQSRYFIGAVAVDQAVGRGAVSHGEQRPLAEDMVRALGPNEKPVTNVAVSSLVVGLPGAEHPVQRFLLYFGPSDFPRLSSLGHELGRSVDLGWNWIRPISELLLRLLVWVHMVVRNYGLAILVLATLVRVLLYPLNAASLRSMRAMQKLQPEIERVRAKYKNDSQAMNAALMALYKEHKVNPAGGCLPVLLQMPILMGLYQVLLNAIELRQAPFALWIDDLSAPDTLFHVSGFPIHLMPVLMAGSGFLQQKLTPMNPQQAPTQYMMNAFMLVLFYNLPSGLVMYWTVMNLLSAWQQWRVLRQDEPAVVVVPDEGGSKKRKR
ncbi:MAG: membrane protein insertase YidC [Candidatus Eisenbacteria bacterium]|nr:membrane protein insertase YidC [Candidatus Eisenbacteria bacterium]